MILILMFGTQLFFQNRESIQKFFNYALVEGALVFLFDIVWKKRNEMPRWPGLAAANALKECSVRTCETEEKCNIDGFELTCDDYNEAVGGENSLKLQECSPEVCKSNGKCKIDGYEMTCYDYNTAIQVGNSLELQECSPESCKSNGRCKIDGYEVECDDYNTSFRMKTSLNEKEKVPQDDTGQKEEWSSTRRSKALTVPSDIVVTKGKHGGDFGQEERTENVYPACEMCEGYDSPPGKCYYEGNEFDTCQDWRNVKRAMSESMSCHTKPSFKCEIKGVHYTVEREADCEAVLRAAREEHEGELHTPPGTPGVNGTRDARNAVLEVVSEYTEPDGQEYVREYLVQEMQELLTRGQAGLNSSGFNDASEMMVHLLDVFPEVENLFKVTASRELICYDGPTMKKSTPTGSPGVELPIILGQEHLMDKSVPNHYNALEEVSMEDARGIDVYNSISESCGTSPDLRIVKKASYTPNGMFLSMQIQPIMRYVNEKGGGRSIDHRFVEDLKTKTVRDNLLFIVNGKAVRFRLIGIVYVVYDTTRNLSSHYVAHARRENEEWWFFNDSVARRADRKDVLNFECRYASLTAPSLLFYARDDVNTNLPAKGLQNPGAACYFSALLQAMMPSFNYCIQNQLIQE